MGEKASDRREKLFGRFHQSQIQAGLESKNGMLTCPMCWSPKTLDEFTLEHIVPGAVGGRRTTLTCVDCNNRQGRELDVHLVKYQEVNDALNGFGGIRSRLNVNGKDIAVNVTANAEPKQVNMRVVAQACHPIHVAGLQDDCKDGKVDELTLNLNLGYNKNRMQTALLRIGYLALFHQFGFNYAAGLLAQKVRDRILDPALTTFRLPSFVAGISNWNLPFDRPYFILPRNLNSVPYFQVMIRSRIKTTTYHGIALPGLDLQDESFFSAFETYSRENRELTIRGLTKDDILD